MRISDWSSDVCSSDLRTPGDLRPGDDHRDEPGHPLDPRAGGVFFRHPAHAKPRVAQERRALQATRYTGAAGQRPREDTARQGGLMSAPVTMPVDIAEIRSEEHTSELQSLMRISYAVFCLKTKTHLP